LCDLAADVRALDLHHLGTSELPRAHRPRPSDTVSGQWEDVQVSSDLQFASPAAPPLAKVEGAAFGFPGVTQSGRKMHAGARQGERTPLSHGSFRRS
jgi:hypothetical protein